MAATVNSGEGKKRNIVIVESDGTTTSQIDSRILKGSLTANNTYTLPDAGANKFKTWTIDNDTGSDLIVNTTSSQTINGNLFQIIPNNNSMTIYSNGSNYRII